MLQTHVSLPVTFAASEDLYLAVRTALVARRTTLSAWCRANSISRQTMEKALKGEREGKRSRQARQRLMSELFAEQAAI